MDKKKTIVIVSLFICLLMGLRFYWIFVHQKSDYPQVKEGVLDLREIPIPVNETLSLNGDWEFFQGQLIEPGAKSLEELSHALVKVPERQVKSNRKGTYRLRILLNEQSKQPYSIYFQEIKSASTIYINGKKVEELDQKHNGKKYSKLNYQPYEVHVDGNVSEIELLIHITNDTLFRSSGITKPIEFGTYSAMKKERLFTFSMEFISISVLFFHGIYVLIIFSVFVRKKEVLYLATAFFCMAMSVSVDDDKSLFYFFPSVSFEWWKILLYLSYASAVFFLLQFIQYILTVVEMKNKSNIYINKIFCALYFLLIFWTLTQPLSQISFILFYIVMLYGSIIFVKVSYQGISTGQGDSIYIILVIMSVASSIIWGIIKNTMNLEYSYYPFDLIVGVIIFSIFWFHKFFQATKESKELTLKLQKKDKTRDEFLANTSHELRNPLHGIINITNTILESEKDSLNEENRENLQLLMKVGRRMSLILSDLLDITKLKEGAVQLQFGSVNVLSVVSSVIDMLCFMTEEKNISFEIHISKTFPTVKADENRLFQILFNLLHNAVKYTNEGTIKIFAEVEDGVAIIRVEDPGIGMDQETLHSIFKPYEQVNSSRTAIAGGIGLGLSICEQLVKLHGGILSVKSIVGIGSTFTFTLPVDSNDTVVTDHKPSTPIFMKEESDLSERPTIRNEESPSILVVDDDPMNLSILKRILISEPYNVVTCTCGQAAIQLLNTGIWDLVITDVMMPNMSGYELTRKIRDRFSITELPILLLTARNQIEDIQAGFYYGANDYVIKPVEQLELKTRVKVLINLKKSINERIRMEAAWLQAQIQPHFLFNTLNTIAALSEINPCKMMELLDEFGNYLRASFNTQNLNQVIPINQEIKLVRSYVFIQQQRFNERLKVEWEVDEHVSVQIPPLSIQPLVENAIKHGVLKQPNGGIICIQVIDMKKGVQVAIIDNGVGISKNQLQTLLSSQQKNDKRGIGLLNTDKRLKQLYGHGLDISSIPSIGTTVRFIIPK
ncbi:ATP-binding protein [Bacillus sp. JJ722]|uniref:ATP-binding protein n=1 Tax=Bacillus sp. JJ722 TaxID=3122973 RepID=UPI002FFF64FE